MQCQEQLEQYLHENQAGYQIQHHLQAETARQVAEREYVSGRRVAKSVVVVADHRNILLVLPASCPVDLTGIHDLLQVCDVHLASEEDLCSLFTNRSIGAIALSGNLSQLPVYVEEHLTRQESIVFPAGTCTETMSLAYADFARLIRPTVAWFAYKPAPVQTGSEDAR
jgi:Ala-tRNA(Pro) deacylase